MFEIDLAMCHEPLIEGLLYILRTWVHSVGFSHGDRYIRRVIECEIDFTFLFINDIVYLLEYTCTNLLQHTTHLLPSFTITYLSAINNGIYIRNFQGRPPTE
jgi:hypothetical protein